MGEPASGARPSDAAGTPAEPWPEEVASLLDHLFVRVGLDFRHYSRRAVDRRLRQILIQDGLGSVRALRARIMAGGEASAAALASRLRIGVTSLFRDPSFWLALRQRVLPRLRELPLIRAWSAGCSTGEEAYSLAILLHEEGLAARARIYATDVDEFALAQARSGSLPLPEMAEYSRNYLRAGGDRSLSAYYYASSGGAAVLRSLRRAIVFSRHDLGTDAPFHTFHLVLCRNVLIYFDPWLQRRAYGVLHGSLALGGILGVGLHEVPPEPGYALVDGAAKLYARPESGPPSPA